jgi:hypothetical protein
VQVLTWARYEESPCRNLHRWPNEGMDLRIDSNLIKECRLLQRTGQFPFEDRTEINDLRRTLVTVRAYVNGATFWNEETR